MASHNPDQRSPNRGTFIQGMFHMNRELIEVELMSAGLTGEDLQDAMNSRLGDVEHIIPEIVRDLIQAHKTPTPQQIAQSNDAEFKLQFFNEIILDAFAFQKVREQNGEIDFETAQDKINLIQAFKMEIIQGDSFSCGICGESTLQLFGNNDGECVFCLRGGI